MTGEANPVQQKRPGSGFFWAVTSLIVMTFVITAVVGVDRMRETARSSCEIAAARKVVLALATYTADEPDSKIENLDDLLTKGLLKDDSVLYEILPDGSKRPRWLYFGYDRREPSKAVIVSAQPRRGKRVIGTTDTSVELMREGAWEARQREK